MQIELHAFAHEVGCWTEGKTRSKLHAILRTLRETAARKNPEMTRTEY